MVSRGSNFSNTSLFDPDDWDQMAVDVSPFLNESRVIFEDRCLYRGS
jgi:hypothetical protein